MDAVSDQRKRNVAYKLSIGDILKGKPNSQEGKFLFLSLDEKKVVRVNVLANCVDKYVQDGEKKYASLTLDDASGQIRIKAFGEDIEALKQVIQGDTLQIIGNVREWNGELYLLAEIIKKVDPRWLLVRKLEIEKTKPATIITKSSPLRDIVIQKIKDAESQGGIDVDTLKMEIGGSSKHIDEEIKKFLEEGLIYEPRPGKLRYLG